MKILLSLGQKNCNGKTVSVNFQQLNSKNEKSPPLTISSDLLKLQTEPSCAWWFTESTSSYSKREGTGVCLFKINHYLLILYIKCINKIKWLTACRRLVLNSKCLSLNKSKRWLVVIQPKAPPTPLIVFANAMAGQINELSQSGGRIVHLKVR